MPALGALELAEVIFWLGVLIFCYLCILIAKALLVPVGGVLGFIPGVGGWLKGSVLSIAHRIVTVMSSGIDHADEIMGASLHDAARLTDWIGREIKSHATQLFLLADTLTGTLPAAVFRKQFALLLKLAQAGEQALRGIGHDVLPRIRTVERGIGADVMPRLRALDRELGRVEGKELPALRARVKELDHGAADTWKWIRTHPLSLATTAFAGAVAVALQRLGGSWIRCRNWNRIGRAGCGMPVSDLEALLGLLGTAAVVADFRDLVKLAQRVEHGVAAGLQDVAKL